MKSIIIDNDTIVLESLLEKVYRNGGYDFRNYKRGTVTRRLNRRLLATGAKTYPDYIRFLDTHPEEYERLIDYLTINVSSFFRSAYTFQQVARMVFPELVSYKKSQGEPSLRFWSTACACGEEPYSIATLVTDFLGNKLRDFSISIYATDINSHALRKAQAGAYSPTEVEGLPPTILANYFTRQGEGYMVNSDIRQMVSFSSFDLASTTPPPFMNLDCIFCCNVLIYLQKPLQERVLGTLYSLLNSPGYLILGEVEAPTNSLNEKLECLDNKAKIYIKSQD